MLSSKRNETRSPTFFPPFSYPENSSSSFEEVEKLLLHLSFPNLLSLNVPRHCNQKNERNEQMVARDGEREKEERKRLEDERR